VADVEHLAIAHQLTHQLTESEYKQLPQFQNLPLYDEGDPLTSTVDLPGKEDPDGTIWVTVHEATDLKTAQVHLQNGKLVQATFLKGESGSAIGAKWILKSLHISGRRNNRSSRLRESALLLFWAVYPVHPGVDALHRWAAQ
jgi:hypothetical protein